MNPLTIRTRLTLNDWSALRAACTQRTAERVTVRSRLLRLLPFFFAGLIAMWIVERAGMHFNGSTFVLGAVAAVVLIVVSSRMTLRRAVPDPDGVFLSELVHEFSADGIHSLRPGFDSHIAWNCIKEVTVTAQHLFLWTDRYQAVVVPVRDLPEGIDTESARSQFEAWRTEDLPATQVSESDTRSLIDVHRDENAVSWPRVLSRLLLLRNVDRAPVQVSLTWILGLAAALLCAWVGIDWWDKQADGEFYFYNVPMLAWFALAVLGVSGVAGALSTPRVDLRRTLIVSLAAALMMLVIMSIADQFITDRWFWMIDLAAIAYVLVFSARALRALSGAPQLRAATLAAVTVFAIAWLTNVLYVDASLWTEPDSDDESTAVWQDGEEILFDQPARIDTALDKVAASSPDAPHNFFLGFAGVGEQRVFSQEIGLASKVIGEKYETAPRTLQLINDRRDLEAAPLATVSGLRYALTGMAKLMDLKQDVLFLSISSHGSEDPLIAVSNSGLPLSNLSPEDLAAALDDAGIQWRVIVISACHAGAFIDALKNDKTIVITAAAADRVSFGCADDRDLTYFGEAFYRDALPKSRSLRDAFEVAKREIAERERNEGFASSKPQAYFGTEIESKLAATLPIETVSK
jgi:hypothetical protein